VTAMPALSPRTSGVAVMRCRQNDTRVALAAHLLGLGAGATMIIGLAPAALALVRALI